MNNSIRESIKKLNQAVTLLEDIENLIKKQNDRRFMNLYFTLVLSDPDNNFDINLDKTEFLDVVKMIKNSREEAYKSEKNNLLKLEKEHNESIRNNTTG